MTATAFPLPLSTPLTSDEHGKPMGIITKNWSDVLNDQFTRTAAAPQVVDAVSLIGQGAAIVATNLVQNASAGTYRISWYLRITRSATVSSAVQITIGWTDGGVGLAKIGTNVAGNTTSSLDQGMLIATVQGLSALTYAVSYSTSGATAAQYAVYVIAELVRT